MNRLLLALICVAAFAGCPAETPTAKPAAKPPAKKPSAPAPSAPAPAGVQGSHSAPATQTFDVQCGCTVKDIGYCSEWAKINGQYVQIVGKHGLGNMPFCGKSNLKAEITGHLSPNGKFHAHSMKIVQ